MNEATIELLRYVPGGNEAPMTPDEVGISSADMRALYRCGLVAPATHSGYGFHPVSQTHFVYWNRTGYGTAVARAGT